MMVSARGSIDPTQVCCRVLLISGSATKGGKEIEFKATWYPTEMDIL
jgi:hypothetical protein